MAHFGSYDTTDPTTGQAVLTSGQSITLGPLATDVAQQITGSVFTDQSGILYVQQSFDAYDPNNGHAILTTALTTGGPITSLGISPLSNPLPLGSTVVLSSGAPGAPQNAYIQSFALTAAAAGAATSLAVTSSTPTYAFPVGTNVSVMNFDISAPTTVTISSPGTGQGSSFSAAILAPWVQVVYVNGGTTQGAFRLFARTFFQGR
jgi:hypothetical protein